MDYKEKIDLLKWHIEFTEMNGTDAKVLIAFMADANYKTGEVKFGLGELASKIRSDKNSISKSIKKLIQQEAFLILEKGTGTKPTNYKISNLERLNFIFESSVINPNVKIWEKNVINLFGDFIKLKNNKTLAREGCPDCDVENKDNQDEDVWRLCFKHANEEKQLNESSDGRKYKLWLMDNPEPKYRIKTIKGKIVE